MPVLKSSWRPTNTYQTHVHSGVEAEEPYAQLGFPTVQNPFPVGCLPGEEEAYEGYLSLFRAGIPFASYISQRDLKLNSNKISDFAQYYHVTLEATMPEESRKRNFDSAGIE